MSLPEHACTGCGHAQPYVPRYPWHFCNYCRKFASDSKGRRLVFGNFLKSGGFAYHYLDEGAEKAEPAGVVRCLIRGRPVMVREVRFGVVVIEPLPESMREPDWLDLTRP